MKKLGGIMFLVGTIATIVMAVMYKDAAPMLYMSICTVVAVIGAIMTGSKGIWIWVVATVITYIGARQLVPVATVNVVLKYAGCVLNLVAMFFIWKDSIKDAFKK